MSETPSAELQELARSYGVHLEYRDMSGQIKAASTESLLRILRVLGADLESEADAPKALRERRLERWKRGVDPVIVHWEEEGDGSVDFRFPEGQVGSEFRFQLETETGSVTEWTVKVEQPTRIEVEGESFFVARVQMPPALPTGYYQFSIVSDVELVCRKSLLIRAPRKSYQSTSGHSSRSWGVFCPLYALHGEKSWGAGDFSDLERLIDWTAEQGGDLVATLPMLASNFDGPSPIISPYSPTSRLFWNEFYLDLERIPELKDCPEAQALMASEETQRKVTSLRKERFVDYGRQMQIKRVVLQTLADWIHERGRDQPEAYLDFRYREGSPDVEDYAGFQAAGEKYGRDWRRWPESEEGLSGLDLDPQTIEYHQYVQWKTDEQLQALSTKAKHHGLTWYLDFPVGVDHNSFEVWAHRDLFATGASVGCPPDPVFTKGQNWGFPPAHPDRQRESGYAYLIASIRNHLKYANALRIDHVMGLHRLFWIPNGAEAKDGAFVSTPAEEIYAILSVESHRHKAWLVGEDLGTVPPEVDQAMKQHNVRGMYVIQYEIQADEKQPLRDVPVSTVASVNTHDMPPFASFWSGHDLDDRKDLGLLDETRLVSEKKVREDQRRALVKFLEREGRLESGLSEPRAILQAIHEWLAASSTSVLLLNIEDLWLETEPQNTPNTFLERPNWRKKLRRSFEDFSIDPALLEMLRGVDRLRSNPSD